MRLKVNDILSSYQVFHGLPLFQRQCKCASVTESEGNKIQFCFNYCQLPFPPWELMQFFRLEHRKFAPTDIFPDFSTDIFQDFRNYILKAAQIFSASISATRRSWHEEVYYVSVLMVSLRFLMYL